MSNFFHFLFGNVCNNRYFTDKYQAFNSWTVPSIELAFSTLSCFVTSYIFYWFSKKLQQSILHTLFALASTFVEVIGKCVTEPVLGLLTCAQQSQSTDTRLRCGAGGGGDEYRVYCRCKVRTGSTSSKDPDSPVFKDSVREGAAGYVVSSCTIFTRAGIKEIFQASSTFWFQPV